MFSPGTLRDTIRQRSIAARRIGALKPIGTQVEFIDDGGVRFVVRVAKNLARKVARAEELEAGLAPPESPHNPFLNPDPNLLVTGVTQSHVCLLNKYHVVEQHLLIVTREFERQQSPLNVDDFVALWTCMREYDALAFYNSGKEAGASQSHKHLQMVPLPLSASGDAIPIEPLILRELSAEGSTQHTGLSFQHAAVRLTRFDAIADQAAESLAQYTRLLAASGVDPQDPSPYNLVVTRRWMLVVPRQYECFESISLNALAFAGAFFVRDDQQLRRLKTVGPMAALRHVGVGIGEW